ncbi:hypothetical protein AB0L71_28100 [Streptomyces sp. NPDC052052]|uniref:hypothetical protein n=1 Tax=Streptomyces sp. NPDC052052 TaxID=3154756 RepID=UPI0034453C11
MTTNPELAAMWHDDITINGQPYPTRHAAPDYGASTEVYRGDLADQQRDQMCAIHESAHAVAALVGHAYIHYAKIATTAVLKTAAPSDSGIPGGNVFACNFSDGQDLAVFLGAGERAEDRWLRQNDLWTPRRAVGVELGAYGDRREFLAANPHFGFGADHNDYRVVHDLADQLIAQHWDAITAVADALATRLHLTGGQIARIADLPNGTHSATCTGTPAA